MTMVPTGASDAELEQYTDGMEDFDQTTDAALPRISIDHDEIAYKNSLSGVLYPTLPVIILGLVKQRVMWDASMEDDVKPMCRSTDFQTGYPLLAENATGNSVPFAWDKSVFNPADYPPDADGVVQLPCAACNFKEWKSAPDGKKPWCSEQWTLPILFDQTGGQAQEDGLWHPEWMGAVITFQKTALAPLKNYMTTFAATKTPPFQNITIFSLSEESRGKTTYGVPKFKQHSKTEQDEWLGYSATYRGIREFLTREPVRRGEDVEVVETSEPAAQVAPSAPAAPAPAAAPQAAPAPAAQAPEAAPVAPPAQAPVAPAAPAQAAPPVAPPATPAPVAQTPPAAPAAAPSAPVAPSAPAAPTPPVASAPTPPPVAPSAPVAPAPAAPATPAPAAQAPVDEVVDAEIVEGDDPLPF